MSDCEVHIILWLFLGMVFGFQMGWLGGRAYGGKQHDKNGGEG